MKKAIIVSSIVSILAGCGSVPLSTMWRMKDFSIQDVAAIDPKTAWTVGILGTVRKTTDGGETWEDVSLDLPKVQLYSIASDGAGTITIAGNGLCVVSTDAGVSWQPAEFEPTIEYGWIYDLQALGAGRFAACGDEGAIYRKPPEGNWKRIEY